MVIVSPPRLVMRLVLTPVSWLLGFALSATLVLILFRQHGFMPMPPYPYYLTRDEPLIFVGGVPRSGTTLMRALLDAHEDVRCGEETQVVPAFLDMHASWERPMRAAWAAGGGVSPEVLDLAAAAFMLQVIALHGPPAPRLCNKDPLTAKHAPSLQRIFPNAKSLLMIRDPRAVIHSIIWREVPVHGFDRNDKEQCFVAWNRMVGEMYDKCVEVGEKSCIVRLVLETRAELERIFRFLELPFSEHALHHQDFVGDTIKLNPDEFSTSQVKREINDRALFAWTGFYDDALLARLDTLAPRLKGFGYPMVRSTNETADYRPFLTMKQP